MGGKRRQSSARSSPLVAEPAAVPVIDAFTGPYLRWAYEVQTGHANDPMTIEDKRKQRPADEPAPHYWILDEYHRVQVQLVIEVTRRHARGDLGSKLEDYLRDGLRELWIIDLVEQCALVYRGGEVVARRARGAGARLVAELVPEVSVDLDEVFRAARIGPPEHA